MNYRPVRLSKSRFQEGLQCEKRLWLKYHRPDLADPPDEFARALFALGHRVGALARERFPGGVLIEAGHREGTRALRETRGLLDWDPPPPALFEAAFAADGVFVRPDVVVTAGGSVCDLIEVKASSKVKEEHVSDVAIQMHVLERSGMKVRGAYLMHLDPEYRYPGGPYDLNELFRIEDITERARAFSAYIPKLLDRFRATLVDECPELPVGRHCQSPYECDFRAHCRSFLPEYPVADMPRIREDLLEELAAAGIHTMLDVPLGYDGLTPFQQRVCRVVQQGRVEYADGLGDELSGLELPLFFLDFETVQPALPLYPGTSPFQAVPFQWSLHRLDERGSGAPVHREYLHEDASDPRRPLLEALLDAVGAEGSIVVWGGYEKAVLAALAEHMPEQAPLVEEVSSRLFDLGDLVRRCVAHPDLRGRWSLKRVVPALLGEEGLSYEGLTISDGATASLHYEEMVREGMDGAEREAVLGDLREYCRLDTLSMVHLYRHLSAATS